MAYKVVFHYPNDPAVTQKLMMDLVQFRTDKTVQYLGSLHLSDSALHVVLAAAQNHLHNQEVG
ncbi:hypothetical protein V6615_12580 [Oscillospiraceae bacterium PP1C4]